MFRKAVFLSILFFPVVAPAAPIYTNLGPNYTFSSVSGGTPVDQFVGIPFTATSTGTLGQIVAPMSGGDASVTSTFGLYNDSGGTPAALIESFSGVVFTPANNLMTLVSTLQPTLTAGMTYWFLVTSNNISPVDWHEGLGSDTGFLWVGQSLSSLRVAFPGDPRAGLQVDPPGTIIILPEPAAGALVPVVLALITLSRNRRSAAAK